MKTCSLNDFMKELNPWLDKDHIRAVTLNPDGQLVVYFMDHMKNVYEIDDCNRDQVREVLADLRQKGVAVEE